MLVIEAAGDARQHRSRLLGLAQLACNIVTLLSMGRLSCAPGDLRELSKHERHDCQRHHESYGVHEEVTYG